MATQEQKIEMLRQICEHYGLKRNVDFAKFFEISEPTAFMRQKSGYLDFEEIYRRCPEISSDWLLSGGEGPMLRADREENIGSNNTNIGDGANQSVSVVESNNMEKVLAALANEQEATKRAQEQVTALIQLLATK